MCTVTHRGYPPAHHHCGDPGWSTSWFSWRKPGTVFAVPAGFLEPERLVLHPPPHAEGRAGRLRLSGGKGLAASGRCHGEGAKVGWCVQGRQKAGQGRQAGSPARWFVRSEGGLRPRWWMAGWGSGM